MRIGLNASSQMFLGVAPHDVAAHAAAAEADGFASYWLSQTDGDALTTLAIVGGSTSRMRLGTAVVPTWTRHPTMLAAQALTVQAATGNRLVLGLGLAHKPSVEGNLKIPFSKPAQHMSEYLDVLQPLMSDRKVAATGEFWSAEIEQMGCPPAEPAPVMLAAMGPKMLELCAQRTQGTILWLSGPTTIAEHIRPSLAAAGAPDAEVMASVPVCVTDDPAGVRATIGALLAGYNDLPSYRAMMDREGVEGVADVSIVGDEDAVRAGIEEFAAAGATEFAAVEFVTNDIDAQRTRELLRELARA